MLTHEKAFLIVIAGRWIYRVCADFAAAVKAVVAAPTQVRTNANSAALEEVNVESAGRKRERLSRQERTALVESFVLKCVLSFAVAFDGAHQSCL